MRNVHTRTIDAPAKVLGALLDRLAGPDDPLWPSPAWPPVRFDRPLAVGADGGHARGRIRYAVTGYEPGRRVRFTFGSSGLVRGHHEFTIEPQGATRCVLRHVLDVEPKGPRAALALSLVVRWLHDAVLEDLLDNAERAATGTLARPARWSPWVRVLRRTLAERATEVPIPPRAWLARAAFVEPDLADAWSVPLDPGLPTDPHTWARTIFGDPAPGVLALLRLRDALVGLVGIARRDSSAFDPVAADGSELLLGTDEGHLGFRVSILVDDGRVTVSTVAAPNSRRGQFYLGIVRHVHPRLIRAMVSRSARRLAVRAPSAGERHRAATRETAANETAPARETALGRGTAPALGSAARSGSVVRSGLS